MTSKRDTHGPFWLVVLFVFVGILLFSNRAQCQTKIPCFKFNKNSDLVITNPPTDCVQMTEKEFKSVVDRLKQLEFYKKTYEPGCEAIKKKYKELDKKWKDSKENWALQKKHYKEIMGLTNQIANLWKKDYYALKKTKTPTSSWTESPVLWFSIGVAAATVAAIIIAVTVDKLLPKTGISSNALRVRNIPRLNFKTPKIQQRMLTPRRTLMVVR